MSTTHATDDAIRQRKTRKMLRDPARCDDQSVPTSLGFEEKLQEIIELAGWAPFHKVVHPVHRHEPLTSVVPWRFYVLERAECCRLVRYLKAQAEAHPDSTWSRAWNSKIPRLLAGAGALIQATWLPDPGDEGAAPALTQNNMEHIAATAAAIQNLLLAAEARGLITYWSSGGILKTGDVFRYLGIPVNQTLLGSVFISHPKLPVDRSKPGGLREHRGTPSDWASWITLD